MLLCFPKRNRKRKRNVTPCLLASLLKSGGERRPPHINVDVSRDLVPCDGVTWGRQECRVLTNAWCGARKPRGRRSTVDCQLASIVQRWFESMMV